MSPLAIASIVFVCVLCSALFGLFLRTALPEHHLSEDSKGVVKLGTGLLATLAALVLGLLIASAKTSFEKINDKGRNGAYSLPFAPIYGKPATVLYDSRQRKSAITYRERVVARRILTTQVTLDFT